jgi:hypothetical protein
VTSCPPPSPSPFFVAVLPRQSGGGVYCNGGDATIVGSAFANNGPWYMTGRDAHVTGGTLNILSLCDAGTSYAGIGDLHCSNCAGPADLSDASACETCPAETPFSCCGATTCAASPPATCPPADICLLFSTMAPTPSPAPSTPQAQTPTSLPTATASPTLAVVLLVSGPCSVVEGACLLSPNYPSDYGNSQSCEASI